MTQHPHDEFDDVPPYQADEVGKHRAPGAVGSSAAAGGGALKWIGLLAALVLVVGAVAWISTQFGDEAGQPTAESSAEQTAEPSPTDQDTDEAAAEEDGAEATEEQTEDGGEDEEATDEETDEVDTDSPVIVYNFDGTPGVAGNVREQLDGAGFNVVQQENWNQGWTTCGEGSPVIVHPPAEGDLAQMLADELGAATCESDGWSDSGVTAVVVGVESA